MKNQQVIQYLKKQRSQIVFESEDDEGAAEWYGHLSDVIEQLEKQTMTIEEASASLGINLAS